MPPIVPSPTHLRTAPTVMITPDAELLQRFAKNEDQEAFTQLVTRHINLVYSTAVRRLSGDAHLAQDVTQAVFNDAARRAQVLVNYRVFSSWLYTSTCFASAKAIRAEQRRRKYEREAHFMDDLLNNSVDDAEWIRLRPFLDEAMQELKAQDRDALLLRFFEAKNFSEIGERLKLTENAARMRVERALEKLRAKLAPYGITSTAAALGGTLAFHAVSAAPAGLVSLVTTAAVSSAAAGSLSLFQWLALNKAVTVFSAALLSVTSVGLRLEQRQQATLGAERVELSDQRGRAMQLRKELAQLTRSATEVATFLQDDAELERLKTEAASLRLRPQSVGTDQLNGSAQTPTRRTPATSVFDISQLDRKPTLKLQAKPKYPFDLRSAGVSGQATVSFVVDREGIVRELKIVDATHKGFEQAAREAVPRWKFAPGMKDGKPVSTRMVLPMLFVAPTEQQPVAPDNTWF